ncbi:YheU family protein [Amphritea sp. HPY]|uniref:YheU family protein n=1 Tax=Amphritea sp. HPY TaxID=3421652 RepID=UPI003D7DCCDE
MIIPIQQLPADTLRNMIEEFVTRDGTDYGETEVGIEQRVEQVKARLISGEVVVLFSQSTGQCNIVASNMLD